MLHFLELFLRFPDCTVRSATLSVMCLLIYDSSLLLSGAQRSQLLRSALRSHSFCSHYTSSEREPILLLLLTPVPLQHVVMTTIVW